MEENNKKEQYHIEDTPVFRGLPCVIQVGTVCTYENGVEAVELRSDHPDVLRWLYKHIMWDNDVILVSLEESAQTKTLYLEFRP